MEWFNQERLNKLDKEKKSKETRIAARLKAEEEAAVLEKIQSNSNHSKNLNEEKRKWKRNKWRPETNKVA